jgi:hypothetical protein
MSSGKKKTKHPFILCRSAIQWTVALIVTAVAPGTVVTVPTVPLFLAGTANRTTIWTEKNYFEMKKGYSLLMSL